jgi:hypothetical protein
MSIFWMIPRCLARLRIEVEGLTGSIAAFVKFPARRDGCAKTIPRNPLQIYILVRVSTKPLKILAELFAGRFMAVISGRIRDLDKIGVGKCCNEVTRSRNTGRICR